MNSYQDSNKLCRMYKFIILVSFLAISCASQKEQKISEVKEVSVVDESIDPLSLDRKEILYFVFENNCKIAWQALYSKKDSVYGVQLRNRSDCKLPFSQVSNLHEKVILRILKDYPAKDIKNIATGGLYTLQPDKSWNQIVAVAAIKSAEYQDFRKNYPKHKSKKSSNAILVDLILQTQPHAPFKEMLAKVGLHFELGGVEKVFQTKNEKGETVIDDAGMMWWRIKDL